MTLPIEENKNIDAVGFSLNQHDNPSVEHISGTKPVVPVPPPRVSSLSHYLSHRNPTTGTKQFPLQKSLSTDDVQHVSDETSGYRRTNDSNNEEFGSEGALNAKGRRKAMRDVVARQYLDKDKSFPKLRAWLAVKNVSSLPPQRSLSSTFSQPVKRLTPGELRQTRCTEIVRRTVGISAKILKLRNIIASNEMVGKNSETEENELERLLAQLNGLFEERDKKANEIIREESPTESDLDFLNKVINQIYENGESDPVEIELLGNVYVYLKGKIELLNAANSTSAKCLAKTDDKLLLDKIIENLKDKAIEISNLKSSEIDLTPQQSRLHELISIEIADDVDSSIKSRNFDDTASES